MTVNASVNHMIMKYIADIYVDLIIIRRAGHTTSYEPTSFLLVFSTDKLS